MRAAAKMMTVVGVLAGTVTVAAPVTRSSDGALVLAGDGFSVAGRTAKFNATTRAQAVALVSSVLGPPTKQGSHGDCGQGAIIGYAKYRGDFELSFVRGKLSGWTADAASPRTAKGIGVGSTLAALRKAYPDVEADPGDEANGGLGPTFQREDGPSGSLDGVKPGSKVTGLFAGATCLPGI